MPRHARKKSINLSIIVVAVVVLALAAFNYWLFVLGQKEEGGEPAAPPQQTQVQPKTKAAATPTPTRTPTPKPTPTPTPTYLAPGKQVYNVSTTSSGPKVSQATFDPQDPARGQKQTVTIKANHTSPIQSVSIKLTTDNKSQTYPLRLTSGTNLSGSWEGSWTIDDTYLYTYIFDVTAASGSEQTSVAITIRQKP